MEGGKTDQIIMTLERVLNPIFAGSSGMNWNQNWMAASATPNLTRVNVVQVTLLSGIN